MCKKYKIAKDIVDNYINSKESFTYPDLKNEIKKKSGGMKVAAAVTIQDYLSNIESENLLKYIPKDQRYVRVKTT